jgi:hypothetical protein
MVRECPLRVWSARKNRFPGSRCGACGTGFRCTRRTKNARAIDNYGQSRFIVVKRNRRSVPHQFAKALVGELRPFLLPR